MASFFSAIVSGMINGACEAVGVGSDNNEMTKTERKVDNAYSSRDLAMTINVNTTVEVNNCLNGSGNINSDNNGNAGNNISPPAPSNDPPPAEPAQSEPPQNLDTSTAAVNLAHTC